MAILADIYWAGSLLPEIIKILFTQSTVVLLRKYLLVLKLFCYNFSLRLHRISWEFPEFSSFREFPAYSRFLQVWVQPITHPKKVTTRRWIIL